MGTLRPISPRTDPRPEGSARPCLLLSFAAIACTGTLDAGWDMPRGLLPVDNRNPIVLCNDGLNDNWQGEYAALFASKGTLTLAGIVIGTGPNSSTNLDDNMTQWRQMVAAAQQSGLRNIPDPMASTGSALVRPSDGIIDSTAPNRSEGAHFIIDTSMRLSQPFRPLVVVTGGKLTDVADAYLMDHTLPERVVVVSALGTVTADGGKMGMPNGEIDKWADIIVAQKFRYVQVSSYYDQTGDVSDNLLAQLPSNAFTSGLQAKQTKVYDDLYAADQVAVFAVAISDFVAAVSRTVQRDVGTDNIPVLTSDPSGPDWLVTQIDGSLAMTRLREMLLDPTTFQPK
jgi:hypothetical protein